MENPENQINDSIKPAMIPLLTSEIASVYAGLHTYLGFSLLYRKLREDGVGERKWVERWTRWGFRTGHHSSWPQQPCHESAPFFVFKKLILQAISTLSGCHQISQLPCCHQRRLLRVLPSRPCPLWASPWWGFSSGSYPRLPRFLSVPSQPC